MRHHFVFHFDHGGQLSLWTDDRQLAFEVKNHGDVPTTCRFRGPFYAGSDTQTRHRVDMSKLRYFSYRSEKEQGL